MATSSQPSGWRVYRRVGDVEETLADTRRRLTRDEERLTELDNAVVELTAAYADLKDRLDPRGGQ